MAGCGGELFALAPLLLAMIYFRTARQQLKNATFSRPQSATSTKTKRDLKFCVT
jgi:hypothetical protein